MTKRLFVLRHAKSSWDDPRADDHDRPLAPRGHRAVKLLAEHLAANDIHPQQVLCSTARRAQETLQGVAPGGERLIEHELYSAGSDEILERLRRVPPSIASVMVIGHNPAVQMLVLRLATDGDGSFLSDVQDKFPTAALATLTFDCAWSELAAGCARLIAFVRPKTLGRI